MIIDDGELRLEDVPDIGDERFADDDEDGAADAGLGDEAETAEFDDDEDDESRKRRRAGDGTDSEEDRASPTKRRAARGGAGARLTPQSL